MLSPTQETQLQGELTTAHNDFEQRLHKHAFFRIQDRAISEDLVQVTFMKTWTYLLRGGKIDLMKAFLYHILNNLIVDEWRKRKTTSLDFLLEKGLESSVDDSRRLLNIADGKASLLLIQRLPNKYQKVMRMRYVQELTLTEMSLITGQSKNTLAVQLHRGVGKLKLLHRHV